MGYYSYYYIGKMNISISMENVSIHPRNIHHISIDAPPYQSGKFKAVNRHISKRGNKYLRRIGYTTMKAVKTFCKSGTELYDYIVQKENEGKSKKSSKIAGLNKFLRQYYGKVRNEYIEIGIW